MMQQNLPLSHQAAPKSTAAMVAHLKQTGSDFEWYPTTTEILNIIKNDIDHLIDERYLESQPSILDCGAGDGRSLMYLTAGKKYAIEKAKPLISAMDREICVIGADFHQQVLMDKRQEIIFSNPPYEQFESWSTKIIRESRSAIIYLVIPSRWKDNAPINDALCLRNAETEVLGSFDFLNAERKARAKVDVIRITMTKLARFNRNSEADTDPFDIWFAENFKVAAPGKAKTSAMETKEVRQDEIKNELVQGRDIIDVLTSLYDRDLAKLMLNYKAFESLDATLLEELGVSFSGVREGLKTKISGLKNLNWNELFNNLNKITDKLTQKSREAMLSKLTSRTDVDFNSDNVYAVVIWVIKNANHYFDDQVIDLVERMVEQANVLLYKSNAKTFGRDSWRYCARPEGLDRFSLETRVVLQRAGGLANTEWAYDRERFNGLSERAYYLIMDILTVATNLGFDTTDMTRPMDFQWVSNKSCDFEYYDYRTGERGILMSVKAFKNHNTHIKFNSNFMSRLNIEFGRLQGWLKSAQEAASELDIPVEDAVQSFDSNLKLTGNSLVQLGFSQAA
jgi:hypothetical protein